MSVHLTVKRWGNSVGVVLPASLHFKDGDQVDVEIHKTQKPAKVRDLFGLFADRKTNVKKLMDDVDEELWCEN